MSVVIIGGNECMARRYVDICKEYDCTAKVYAKLSGKMKKIGKPDLMILFTNTVSHKMVRLALGDASEHTIIERSHSSSATALKAILEVHTCQNKH